MRHSAAVAESARHSSCADSDTEGFEGAILKPYLVEIAVLCTCGTSCQQSSGLPRSRNSSKHVLSTYFSVSRQRC